MSKFGMDDVSDIVLTSKKDGEIMTLNSGDKVPELEVTPTYTLKWKEKTDEGFEITFGNSFGNYNLTLDEVDNWDELRVGMDIRIEVSDEE